ncbi:MAG: Ribosomal RNA small subunit methyltransferase I [Chlamydiae bacterium]|nr:Ribosomal RNA small subunit methyltransferase I [Chlamydiota bacterium]
MSRGKLLLLPNLLGDLPHHELFLPASVDKAVESIAGLIAESEKGGRRFLSRFKTEKRPHEIPIALLNKHHQDIDFLLEPLQDGETWGLVSDAGLPCVADPGALLVARARELGLKIQAFVGPSSVTLSLMLSGFTGQSFHFHGYLPKDPKARDQKITNMEKDRSTQIFIEAPHRNQKTLEALVGSLRDQTKLCVAWDLTLPSQGIVSQNVAVWKKSPLPNVHKKPAIFLLNANE